jgi:hypothetical protein
MHHGEPATRAGRIAAAFGDFFQRRRYEDLDGARVDIT